MRGVKALFIGAIAYGMFGALIKLEEEQSDTAFAKMRFSSRRKDGTKVPPPLMLLMDAVLDDREIDNDKPSHYLQLAARAAVIRDSAMFRHFIIATIVFVGLWIGFDLDVSQACDPRITSIIPVPENCGENVARATDYINIVSQVLRRYILV